MKLIYFFNVAKKYFLNEKYIFVFVGPLSVNVDHESSPPSVIDEDSPPRNVNEVSPSGIYEILDSPPPQRRLRSEIISVRPIKLKNKYATFRKSYMYLMMSKGR